MKRTNNFMKILSKWYLVIVSIIILIAIGTLLFIKKSKPKFNGDYAYAHLVKQVEFGSRISGTVGHDKTKEYLVAQLKQFADIVSEQTFDYTDRHDSSKIYKGINIVASFNISEDVTKRILLCAHWDSRPFADNDPNIRNHNLPVPGANDGASGVAVLLEMARLLSQSKPNVGVDIVFFDLEDIGDETDSSNNNSAKNPFCIGSEIFVKDNPEYFPVFGILLDMIGDKELRIPKEAFSLAKAKDVVEKVWKAASDVGSSAFLNESGHAVIDDHIAFLKKSIPVIDLIHTPFPKTWHTIQDIPENCSSASLQQVGNVLVKIVYDEE